MVDKAFIGTWEIVNCVFSNIEKHSFSNFTGNDLLGIKFILSKNGDVSWIIPDKFKNIPLFQCETYEYHTRTGIVPNLHICFGAYIGQIFEFRIYNLKSKKRIILSGCGLHEIDCHYVEQASDSSEFDVPFSLLPALEEGYFSDLTITAKNKRQFKIHKIIVSLQAPDVNWATDPPPFSFLSEDTLGTILYFLYSECLPEDLTESTAEDVIKTLSEYKCLEKLTDACKIYLTRLKVTDEILGLLNDIHLGICKIAEYVSPSAVAKSDKSDTILVNPATLFNAIKHCFREGFVVIAKFIQFCDIFTARRNNKSNEEQDEILYIFKSKVPIYKQEIKKCLEGLKRNYRSMSQSQKIELATFIVPEIASILSMGIALLQDIDIFLQKVIDEQKSSIAKPQLKGNDNTNIQLPRKFGLNELSCLICVQENIKILLEALTSKREQYSFMTLQEQTQVISRILDYIIKEELPVFLIRLDEIVDLFDEKLELHEFKFFFKVETSRVTYALKKLLEYRNSIQGVVTLLCEIIQRDGLTQTLQNLKLIPESIKENVLEPHANEDKSTTSCLPQNRQELNLVKSLCVPPAVQDSNLSKNLVKLFNEGIDTDMEFEIICDTKENSCENNATAESDRHIFKAHRVIVAARCDWFRRALLSGMKEAIHKRIEIHETNPAVFKVFLEYLYGGKIQKQDLSMEQLLDLMLLSDRYEMDALKQTCECSLKKSIDIDSVLYLLNIAYQYNAMILKKMCTRFILAHHELMEGEEFGDLPLALQSEIIDMVWTMPEPTSDSDLESDVDSIYSDVVNKPPTTSEEAEGHSTSKLESQVAQLRNILGDAPTKSCLVQLILAADYNLERAINFYYSA